MLPYLLVLIYSVLIVAACLLGGWIPSRFELSHVRMQVILSFVGGLMLGVAILHLIPHGMHHAQSLDLVLGATLIGLLTMFFLIRTFHFHQHGPTADAQGGDHFGHGCEHDHHHPSLIGDFSWAGVAAGLALHTLIDGIALGAAVRSESLRGGTQLAGLAVFLAILLHKPLDALSITTLMTASKWDRRIQRIVVVGVALMCPLGTFLFLFGAAQIDESRSMFIGAALGFSAGVFLCISLSDLLPEVQFHRHDRGTLSAALLLGVALAYAVRFLEPAHVHDLPAPTATEEPWTEAEP